MNVNRQKVFYAPPGRLDAASGYKNEYKTRKVKKYMYEQVLVRMLRSYSDTYLYAYI